MGGELAAEQKVRPHSVEPLNHQRQDLLYIDHQDLILLFHIFSPLFHHVLTHRAPRPPPTRKSRISSERTLSWPRPGTTFPTVYRAIMSCCKGGTTRQRVGSTSRGRWSMVSCAAATRSTSTKTDFVSYPEEIGAHGLSLVASALAHAGSSTKRTNTIRTPRHKARHTPSSS